jgi:hypothetical protein
MKVEKFYFDLLNYQFVQGNHEDLEFFTFIAA